MKLSTFVALGLGAAVLPTISAQPQGGGHEAALGALRMPIHTQADDPAGGAYGLWAVGPNYKVAFADGFTFYPVLGESAPHNLPLRWRTQRISVGGETLVDGSTNATAQSSEWRYELRYPGVTEAYDVLVEGVEQTFVLHAPVGGGELVVEGRIDSALRAQPSDAAVQRLVFCDDGGREVVRYGKALAVDASDRRLPVETSFDGTTIRMTVPGDWLETADYPVTLDPLTSSRAINTAAGGFVNYPNVARDDQHNQQCIVYSRPSAASDWDLFAVVTDDTQSTTRAIFADTTASWSSRYGSVAYVRSANRWVVGIGRNFGADAKVRAYLHDGGNTTLQSGTLRYLAPPAGFSDQHPAVGGNRFISRTSNAVIAFRRDPNNGSPTPNHQNSMVYAVHLDAATMTFGSPFAVRPPAGVDSEWPMVTADSGGDEIWAVVWQEYNFSQPSDDWDVLVQRIDASGLFGSSQALGPVSAATRHKLHPSVAGSNERFLVSFLMQDRVSGASSMVGNEFAVQRFDWPAAAAARMTAQPWRSLSGNTGSDTLRATVTNRNVAYDSNTESHWAVAYRTTSNVLYTKRIGYTGRVVENALVSFQFGVNAGSASVCYNSDSYEFPIYHGSDAQATLPLLSRRLQYNPAASNWNYGSTCGANISGHNRGSSQRAVRRLRVLLGPDDRRDRQCADGAVHLAADRLRRLARWLVHAIAGRCLHGVCGRWHDRPDRRPDVAVVAARLDHHWRSLLPVLLHRWRWPTAGQPGDAHPHSLSKATTNSRRHRPESRTDGGLNWRTRLSYFS